MPSDRTDSLEYELAARRAFVEHMLKHTVRVVRLVENEPAGTGSGLFYAVGKQLFLLSVLHVFEGDGWFVETDTAVKDRTLMLKLPRMNWVVTGTIDHNGRPVAAGHDGLAWAELDIKEMSRAFAGDEALAGHTPAVNAYVGPLDARVRSDESYSFVAAPGREFHRSINTWPVEPLSELDMAYEGDDERGFNRFRLAGPHRGGEFYKGCSGAPIAERDGTVVALLQGGDESEGVVFGVPLRLYTRCLQLTIA